VQGIVISINISHKKGLKKTPVKEAIVNERGIVGDAHAGEWHRQISLLAEESIEKMRELGLKIGYGDFAENITTKNIDLSKLRIGQKIRVGKEVILEITQIGKKCHDECEIKRLIGKCVMPKEGVFARVISGGKIKVGDEIIVLE